MRTPSVRAPEPILVEAGCSLLEETAGWGPKDVMGAHPGEPLNCGIPVVLMGWSHSQGPLTFQPGSGVLGVSEAPGETAHSSRASGMGIWLP